MTRDFLVGRSVKPVELGFSISVLLPLIFICREHHLSIFYPIAIWVLYLLRFYGVLIDYEKRKIKVYSSFLFVKWGDWRSIEEFPFYMIKLIVHGGLVSSKVGEMSYESRDSCLVLFDKTNRKEVLIKKGNKNILKEIALSLESIGVRQKVNRFKKH